ncbi:hypothetical protein JMJ35_000710 [Cladonia borealis]|uniref:Fungal N-terminal domain-containing protein n=1 Tax=Cladonia borealis TaxID=184061 RepID=A0AA39R9Y0_9LECA|nr:hypothetical protein JMJ35_000710 [Cladonia borealis]
MEAIAAISSIAGILSLLCQAIDNTTKLRDFLSEASSASETAGQLLHDLDSLLQTLDTVNSLVKLLPPEFKNSNIVSLHLRIEAYTKDVFDWFKVAKDIRPAQNGAKAWFKKLWIATNIKSVREIRVEIDRHKETISLDLTILGRTLDISTAAHIKEVERGTAASLSMIEEQSSILERIEAYTETGMQESTASARSLQSIATSLSRLESLTSSAARSSPGHKRREVGSPRAKSWSGSKRVDSGYYSIRTRSGSSTMCKRVSSASAGDLPPAPSVSDGKISMLQDGCISEASWESQSLAGEAREDENMCSLEFKRTPDANPEPCTPMFKEKQPLSLNLQTDRSLHEQYRLFHKLTQRFTETLYPPDVIEYIYVIQLIKDYENKVNVLNLLHFGSNMHELALLLPDRPVESDLYVLRQERDALQNRLKALREILQNLRVRCISEGYALYDIDHRFGLLETIDAGVRPEDRDPNSNLIQPTPQTASEILAYEVRKTNSRLLGTWSSNRDRVNRWLLHCLQADDTQAQLHKSILAEHPADDTDWARQLLGHWYWDEAATGGELQLSLSVGAVHSHTAESNAFDNDSPMSDIRSSNQQPLRLPFYDEDWLLPLTPRSQL